MVVDNIEYDSDSDHVRFVDELTQLIRLAVESGRSEKVDAVVAPAEASRKFRDRHHLYHRDAERGQFSQLTRGGAPSPFACERADVHLVNDLAAKTSASPIIISPLEALRVNHARRAMRAFGLKA